MNWLGLVAVLALAAIILSVITDVEMTKCQSGSVYAMVHQAGQTGGDGSVRMPVSWRL